MEDVITNLLCGFNHPFSGPIFLDRKNTKNSVLFRKGMENTFTIFEKNLGPIQRIKYV